MTTAKDIMNPGAEYIGAQETLRAAASKMAELGVDALPICSEENRLVGMLTDRDIAVKCIAQGGNPDSVTAGEFRQEKAVTIGADDDVAEVLHPTAVIWLPAR